MIRFNCHCTHEFLVPDDQAGGMVQCPKCSRLNDVPLLNDLANLDEGGIFKIGEGPKAPGSDVIPKTSRAFTRDKRDDHGNDIDMRPTVEEFLNIGAEEIPLAMADEERPGTPKYDPLTGELVETIKIKPPDQPIIDPKTIPVARRAVSYAAGDLDPPVTPIAILLHLFKPVNLFVMSFVIAVHIFFGVIESLFIVGTSGLILSVPFITIFGIFGVLTSHYGIVVDEIAFGNADELPRPMRDLSLGEDFLKQVLRFHAAMILSFWPMLFRNHMTGQVGAAFFVTSLLFCFFFFPALLLTALLGESYLNLRPDRVIGTIRACGSFVLDRGHRIRRRRRDLSGDSVAFMTMRNGEHVALEEFTPDRGLDGGCVVISVVGRLFVPLRVLVSGIALSRQSREVSVDPSAAHSQSANRLTLAHCWSLPAERRGHQKALRDARPDRDERLAEIRAAENAKRAKGDAKPIWDRVAESRNE